MKYMMIIPFTDLADERPRVATKFMEAGSEDEATELANELAGAAHQLMDIAVCDWRKYEEWAGLTGDELLWEAGYAFGAVELWREEQFLHVAETGFGPCDLERHQGSLSPVPPSRPAPAAST